MRHYRVGSLWRRVCSAALQLLRGIQGKGRKVAGRTLGYNSDLRFPVGNL
jgi:hypothetical protein